MCNDVAAVVTLTHLYGVKMLKHYRRSFHFERNGVSTESRRSKD